MDSVKGASGSFWTTCTSCNMKLEYEKKFLSMNLMCPQCKEIFVAIEMTLPPGVETWLHSKKGASSVANQVPASVNPSHPPPRGRAKKVAPSVNPIPPAPCVDSTLGGVKPEKGRKKMKTSEDVDRIKSHLIAKARAEIKGFLNGNV